MRTYIFSSGAWEFIRLHVFQYGIPSIRRRISHGGQNHTVPHFLHLQACTVSRWPETHIPGHRCLPSVAPSGLSWRCKRPDQVRRTQSSMIRSRLIALSPGDFGLLRCLQEAMQAVEVRDMPRISCFRHQVIANAEDRLCPCPAYCGPLRIRGHKVPSSNTWYAILRPPICSSQDSQHYSRSTYDSFLPISFPQMVHATRGTHAHPRTWRYDRMHAGTDSWEMAPRISCAFA